MFLLDNNLSPWPKLFEDDKGYLLDLFELLDENWVLQYQIGIAKITLTLTWLAYKNGSRNVIPERIDGSEVNTQSNNTSTHKPGLVVYHFFNIKIHENFFFIPDLCPTTKLPKYKNRSRRMFTKQ